MKVKKRHIQIGGAIIGIIIVIFALKLINKPTYPEITSPRPILGNPDADIKIVEFSDFQCPACAAASAYPERLISDYGDKISVEFKHFPLSFHTYAYKAAEAAECANDQNAFWLYERILFANQAELKVKDLKGYAKEIGLDSDYFNACLDSGAKSRIIEDHIMQGYAQNIPGTPTFFVNENRVESIRYDDIAAEIDLLIS